MEIWLWVSIGILIAIIIALLVKIHILQRSVKEIEIAFADRLVTDTNVLIDISSSDKNVRRLANTINGQLRKLRTERRRFQQGDLELKNAVTNISHDLRTPLTALSGYLELLEQEEKSESVNRYIEIIKDRVDILTQLSEELFKYSVIISTKDNITKEQVIINTVLEESIAAFYTVLTERNIVPEIQVSETKVVRMLDRSALSRVFSNLISNVIKYSDGDLKIVLSENGEIAFSNMASGLDEIQVGRLFDRFYTVEAARKSTGLGLTISKTLVEQMKGTISAIYENNRLSIHIFFPDLKE
ncbi:sensor histidine kinase [Roseburia sp. 1XD42-69]|uniref:sensor histidine kinase n=1 Tax=Roseburia sp. 1XD42-69 TaxID=2320088 RepID=UPI000EA302A0|nr:HAMP domain-containing sensor histidine kinase [Roseburia sp. 1XD42-69]RKJ62478.1 sensor histidine kinase [Roseburia sp. 1XD42-69]